MKANEFKSLFGVIAIEHGYQPAFGAWSRQSNDTIAVLNLQRSKNGPYFDLNIKFFVQDLFGLRHDISQALVNEEIGTLMTRQPVEYTELFQLDSVLSDTERRAQLESLFRDFIDPLISCALSREGLRSLIGSGRLFALPAVRQALGA